MDSDIFTRGSKVEVSSDEPGFHGAWYVATLVNIVNADTNTKKYKKSSKRIMFEVKYDTLYQEDDLDKLLTEFVDPRFVRPVPPVTALDDERDFEVDDVVDVYIRDGWWVGVVKNVIISIGDNDGDQNSRKYLVGCYEEDQTTEVEVEIGKSEMRFHHEWVDSCWKKIPPKNKNKNKEKNKKNNQEIFEAENRKTVQKRKRGKPRKLHAERPNDLHKRRSCSGPRDKHDEASVAQNNTEYQQVWPFIKQSAMWATIESLESYQQPPQKPHFSPLKKIKADYREGLAISHIVTFGNLVQKISKIQFTDPADIIKDSLETLANLETHGFDVGPVRSRLNELLSLNDKMGQLRDMAKKDEEKSEKCKEQMIRLDARIKGFQKMMEQSLMMKNVENEKVIKLQSNLNLLSKQVLDCEVAFKKIVTTPL